MNIQIRETIRGTQIQTGINGIYLFNPINKFGLKFNLLFCALVFLLCGPVFSKTKNSNQVQLTTTLTAFGAKRAGNGKEIPAWTGQTDIPMDEKPLFVITHENHKQHAPRLTQGQMALFEQYPDSFSLPIYPSHRTAMAPNWVYKNTHENALKTTLNNDNTGFDHYQAGIPFPVPQSALEIYFNHISRWRGLQLRNKSSDAVVFKNGAFTLHTREALVRFDGYLKETKSKYFVSLIAKTVAPSSKSGSGVLVLEPLDQFKEKRAAWSWDKGRRRVIRAPHIAYDSPVLSSSSMRTVDDTNLINGSPDRFNWQLMGKREIYIPYNTTQLASKSLKYKDLLHKNHINPAHTRYELHRVWVIEATLKEKWRHLYSKRRFYLDEDSWQVVAADQYNKQGELWRVSLSYTQYYSGMPGIFPVINVFHDLKNKQYHVMGLQNQEKTENKFNGELAKDSLFTPSGFKRYMR